MGSKAPITELSLPHGGVLMNRWAGEEEEEEDEEENILFSSHRMVFKNIGI